MSGTTTGALLRGLMANIAACRARVEASLESLGIPRDPRAADDAADSAQQVVSGGTPSTGHMAVKYARALAAQVKRDRRSLEHSDAGRAFLSQLDPYLLDLAARVDAATRVSEVVVSTTAGHRLSRRALGALRSRQPSSVVRRYVEQVGQMVRGVNKATAAARGALETLRARASSSSAGKGNSGSQSHQQRHQQLPVEAEEIVARHDAELRSEVKDLMDAVGESMPSALPHDSAFITGQSSTSSSSSSSSSTAAAAAGATTGMPSRGSSNALASTASGFTNASSSSRPHPQDEEEAELREYVELLARDEHAFANFESDCVMFARERERLVTVRTAAVAASKVAAAKLGHGFESNYTRVSTCVGEIAQIGKPPRDHRIDKLQQENARLRRALAKREGGAVGQRHVERWVEANPHWLDAMVAKRMSHGALPFAHHHNHGHGHGQHGHGHGHGHGSSPSSSSASATKRLGASPSPLPPVGAGGASPAVKRPQSDFIPGSTASPKTQAAALTSSSPSPGNSTRAASVAGSTPSSHGASSSSSAAAAALPPVAPLPARATPRRGDAASPVPSTASARDPHAARRRDVIMQMATAVFASSLDTPRLIHTIMESARYLVNADRCALFLVDPATQELYTTIPGVEEEVRLPLASGIAGHVASTGETLNVADAYVDARFNRDVDRRTGYRTKSLLCMPIRSHTGEIAGVAQLVNKLGSSNSNSHTTGTGDGSNADGTCSFTTEDEEVFAEFSTYCGISLANARLYSQAKANEEELSVALEDLRAVSERNHVILELAETIGHELDVRKLAQKVVDAGRSLANADRCALFKVDRAAHKLTSMYMPGTDEKVSFDMSTGIAGWVATHGEPVRIRDVYDDDRFNAEVDKATGYKTVSMMAMPIFDAAGEIVAIVQLINKMGGGGGGDASDGKNTDGKGGLTDGKQPQQQPQHQQQLRVSEDGDDGGGTPRVVVGLDEAGFTSRDEELFDSFAVFAGIALRNADLYEQALVAQSKTRVALELVSYHASASEEEVERLFAEDLDPELLRASAAFDFTIHSRDPDTLCRLYCAWFDELGLMERFGIPPQTLRRLVATVRKSYRPVPYHNFTHAVCVSHTLYAYLAQTDARAFYSDLEVLGLMLATLLHDVDHRGTNNDFHASTNSPLAHVYGTSSLMEKHHWDMATVLLSSPEHNVFLNLSTDEFYEILNVIRSRIIDTDLALHFGQRAKLQGIIKDGGKLDRANPAHKELLASLLMTCADISTVTKKFEDARHWALVVCAEFFAQGDLEKALGKTPNPMFDRDQTPIPKMQVGFISFVCRATYRLVADILPGAESQYAQLESNLEEWKRIADAEEEERKRKEEAGKGQEKGTTGERADL